MNVLFCTTSFPPGFEALKRNLSSQHTLRVKDTSRPLEEQISDIEVLSAAGFPDRVARKTLESAPRLRLVHQFGVGYEAVDIEVATEFGVYVANTPGANSIAVAELTILLMLSLIRDFPEALTTIERGKWGEPMGTELYGKTLGLVGIGNIGAEVAKRASAFGMKVLAYDVYVPEKVFAELGAKRVDLKTLLRESDIVSLHVPLTKETKDLIGEKEFKLMKKTAFLVNTARGGVVHKDALYKALTTGEIRAAALDVFWVEPPDPKDPIFKLKNLIQSPHIGSVTYEAYDNIAKIVAKNVDRVAKGLPPEPCLNPSVVPRKN